MHQGETHVMDWIVELNGYEPEHLIQLQEKVVSLGHFGWMTVVHTLGR
jgi:hypothetical protein